MQFSTGRRSIRAAPLCLLFWAPLLVLLDAAEAQSASAPRAEAGLLDMADWDLDRDGPLALIGTWEFYWKSLLDPRDFEHEQAAPVLAVEVPGGWHKAAGRMGRLGAFGYATYRLRILLGANGGPLFFRTSVISSAYRLFANGELIASNGIVGTERPRMEPDWRPTVAVYTPNGPQLDLVLQVSNYHYYRAGLIRPIVLSGSSKGPFLREATVAQDVFLVGSLFVMGVYHIALFALRRTDRSPLYFGLFCLLIALRTLVTGDNIYILHILPGLPWELLQKLMGLSFICAIPAFTAFVRALFPTVYPRWASVAILGPYGALSGLVVATPAWIYSWSNTPFQILTLLACVLVVAVLIIAARRRIPGALVFLLGFLVLFAATANDILFGAELIHTGDMVGFGLFVFVFSQAFLLSRRFSGAFQKVEEQRATLERMNRAYEGEIQARKDVERRLRSSESTARALLNAPLSRAVLIGPAGEVLYYNRNFERYLEELPVAGDLTGRCVWDLLPAEESALHRSVVHTVMGSGKWARQEYAARGRWFEAVVFPIEDETGRIAGTAILGTDVTERKRMEEQAREQERRLQNADKLTSLGVLVAGVAHEINNPNHAITLSSEFLVQSAVDVLSLMDTMLRDEPDSVVGGLSYGQFRTKFPEAVRAVRDNSQRIDAIVSELKAYAREEGNEGMQPVDINAVVSIAAMLSASLLKKTTDRFVLELADCLPAVPGIRQRIEQVLLNLLQNACQAIRHRREEIRVRTRHDPARGEVVIEVSDEGMGMEEQTLRRIGDPFFTTKRSQGGTGLGLSVSASIVTQHHGNLTFNSVPGQGTTAVVRLPAAKTPVLEEDPSGGATVS